MQFKENTRIQRAVFIVVAVIFIAASIFLYNIISDKSSYSSNTSPIKSVDVMDENAPTDEIKEPDYSYNTITIHFTGSCNLGTMLGSTSFGTFNYEVIDKGPESFLENFEDMFSDDNLTVSFCNSVLSDDTGLIPEDNEQREWSLGPSPNAEVFAMSGIDVVTVNGPHILDYGVLGKKDTEISIIGYGVYAATPDKIYHFDPYGLNISLLTFRFDSDEEFNSALENIKLSSNTDDFVIVCVSCTDEGYQPDDEKIARFRLIIDSGADLVVGTNSNNLQPCEQYNGGFIVYSLGELLDGMSKFTDHLSAVLKLEINYNPSRTLEPVYTIIPVITDSSNPWHPTVLDEVEELTRFNSFMKGERSFLDK